ncbi:MAG: alginate lyase [Bacteroidetes bacterium]|nr:alginate lyase [Bacteroidota bacterium]
MNRAFRITVMVFLATVAAAARTFHVTDAAGVKAVSRSIAPGDTLEMQNGVWMDQQIVLTAVGTEERPVVLRAQVPGKVILSGRSQLRFSGEYIIVEGLLFANGGLETKGKAVIEFRTGSDKVANNSRLTDCAIIGYNPSDKWLDYKWVSMYGRNNRVDHNYFTGKNHQGTLLVVWLDSLPNGHRIDSNHFGPRPDHGENGAEIIRIGTSDWSMFSSRTTVESNYFSSCDGEVEIISNKSCDNVYRYNTFVECAGSLTLRHGNRASVYGNYFFGHHKKNTGGVRVIGEDHLVYNNYFDGLDGDQQYSALSFMLGVDGSKANGYFQVKRARILFNTFIDNRNNIVTGVTGSDPSASLSPVECRFANNLLLRSRGTSVREIVPLRNAVSEGNLSDGPVTGSILFRTADVAVAVGRDAVWRLEKGSAAIDAAAEVYPPVNVDLDGQQRSGRPDTGADEYSTEEMRRRPMQAGDTGPRWNYQQTTGTQQR